MFLVNDVINFVGIKKCTVCNIIMVASIASQKLMLAKKFEVTASFLVGCSIGCE